MKMIEVTDLCKTYGVKNEPVHAVNHITLSIEEGTVNALTGKSGSGKSQNRDGDKYFSHYKLFFPDETVVETTVGSGVATGADRDRIDQLTRIVSPLEIKRSGFPGDSHNLLGHR